MNALKHLLTLKPGDKVRIINFEGLSNIEMLILSNNNFFATVDEVNTYPCTDCEGGLIYEIYIKELPDEFFIGDDFEIVPHKPPNVDGF